MPRVTWSKVVAYLIRKGHVEYDRDVGVAKCKLCGEEIEAEEGRFKAYAAIYRHFKEKHPEKIEEIRNEVIREENLTVG